MRQYTMIDEPTPFDTLENWERYAARLGSLPEDSLERATFLRDAQEWVERKREERDQLTSTA
jgi:hypothetical protein